MPASNSIGCLITQIETVLFGGYVVIFGFQYLVSSGISGRITRLKSILASEILFMKYVI